jgi:hypothetical protein
MPLNQVFSENRGAVIPHACHPYTCGDVLPLTRPVDLG